MIVEAAESSPQAAASAAYQIRKFLSKDNSGNRPYVQYNAIMLIRILADNPGETFTRNMDAKFVHTVKDLLKHGRDPSVQQILRETLDSLEAKTYDEHLAPLTAMWRAEKERGSRTDSASGVRNTSKYPNNFHVPPYNPHAPPVIPSQQQTSQRVFGRNQLPPPFELASRVEEAKNTAKLLLQLLQSTPTDQVLANDLMKEFAERCQSAQRSIQEYINCDSPPPDDDTLQTLIEVNEQLSLALSRHQRAVLSARRAMGASSASPNPSVQNSAYPPPEPQIKSLGHQTNNLVAPPVPQRHNANDLSQSGPSPVSPVGQESFTAPPGPPPSKTVENPFADQEDAYPGQSHQPDPEYYGAVPSASAVPPHVDRPAVGGAYYHGASPSYLGRQASAANGLTMHGGVDQPESTQNPWSGQDSHSHNQDGGDVSPISTRAPVTYRY